MAADVPKNIQSQNDELAQRISDLENENVALKSQLNFCKLYLPDKSGSCDVVRRAHHFERILRAQNDAIHTIDLDGNLIEYNEAFLEHLGYSKDEAAALNVSDWDVQWDKEQLIEKIHHIVATPAKFETRHRRKDGTIRDVEITATGFSEDGKQYVLASARDITVRRQNEGHLHLQTAALSAAANGIVITDQTGNIVWVNNAFSLLTGYSIDEVIGQKPSVLKSDKHHSAFYKNLWETILAGNVWKGEIINKRKDGTLYDEEMTITPVVDNNKQCTHFIAIKQDITERKRVEEYLRLHTAALSAAANGIAITDLNGKFVWVNKAFTNLTGYSLAEVIGKKSSILKSEKQGHAYYKELWDTITSGFVWRGELVNKRKDGTLYIEDQIITPVFDSKGVCTHFVSIKQDITHRKQTDEELQKLNNELLRSNEDLKQFAYVASHDLQEPLRMISSYTQLLSNRYQDKLDSDAKQYITFAVDGANRLQNLIKSLLAYSRISREDTALEKVDCENVIHGVLGNLSVILSENNARITFNTLPTIMGNSSLLLQLFQNLIHNALKFRGTEPPRISITAEQHESDWQFSISDNGIGIDKEHYERIFLIFQRLHSREEYPGTGIGLAMCKKIVERYGGKIWLTSAPGAGTTFYFTLPY